MIKLTPANLGIFQPFTCRKYEHMYFHFLTMPPYCNKCPFIVKKSYRFRLHFCRCVCAVRMQCNYCTFPSVVMALLLNVIIWLYGLNKHDDVIKWKHFPRYWPFVRGIHRSPVNSPHKGQWRGALMFTLICARINGWVNNHEAGDLRRHHAHYDVIVMFAVHS